MKESLLNKLDQINDRFEEITHLLSSENIINDLDKYKKINKEYSEIKQVVNVYKQYLEIKQHIEEAKELLLDKEMKALAQEDLNTNNKKIVLLEKELQLLLIPKDQDDEKNIFIEIRAGTGGDEAALFAADLIRMYSRYAERNNWKTNIVSSNESDIGGYKECIMKIEGNNVYSKLKFESGVHRVQRVPETEAQGRIHTSTCTVAIMPETDEINAIELNPNELRIDTFRASGAGGQHINKTDSAVRITHIPTGLVVECQDGRSQHSNKAQAMKVLSLRLYEKEKREQHTKESEHRRSLIGTGDRSERIRTYNFPQGRITDHRINLSLYKLDYILDGDLDELLNAIITENQTQLLAEMGI